MAFAGSREDELEMKLAGLNYEEIIDRGGIYRTVEATTRATDAELERLFVERAGGAAEHGTTTAERRMGGRWPSGRRRRRKILVDVFCDASAFTPEEAAEVFDAALRAG
ncbi:MAG: hypothetical protein JZD41_08555, partial [Thermoproteus sp.]|nr:hypothetical protein [Thermoproteus sp.]